MRKEAFDKPTEAAAETKQTEAAAEIKQTEAVTDTDDMKILLRRLRVSAVLRVLLIMVGVMIVQLVASVLCVAGYMVRELLAGGESAAGLTEALLRYVSENTGTFSMMISIVYAVITIIWCGLLYYRWQWRIKPFSYQKALGGARLPGALGLGFGACVVLTMLVSAAAMLFPEAFASYQQLMDQLDISNSPWTIPYVVLVGPMAEELVFRGVIMDRLKPAFPFWFVNFLQAALFGLFHMNFIQGLYAFCFGLILGLIIEVTGTILASILTHIAFNGTSELFGLISTGESGEVSALWGFLLLAAVFCFVAGLRYFLAQRKLQNDYTSNQQESML